MSRPTLRHQLQHSFQIRGCHPLWPNFPVRSPMSTADTVTGLFPVRSPLLGESLLDFSSSGYLDVSVPRVRLCTLCVQIQMTPHPQPLNEMSLTSHQKPTGEGPGFPIRISPDQCSFASSPKLFAGYHVLLRLLPPRHPPCALSRLTI